MKTNDLKSSTYERVKRANRTYLSNQLKLGFNPKWYAVIHFEHDTTIKKYIQRRLDPIMVEEDVEAVKDQLYRTLYTNNWKKKMNRAKSIWGVEYNFEKTVFQISESLQFKIYLSLGFMSILGQVRSLCLTFEIFNAYVSFFQ